MNKLRNYIDFDDLEEPFSWINYLEDHLMYRFECDHSDDSCSSFNEYLVEQIIDCTEEMLTVYNSQKEKMLKECPEETKIYAKELDKIKDYIIKLIEESKNMEGNKELKWNKIKKI